MAVVTKFELGGKEPKLQPTSLTCVYHVLHSDSGTSLIQLDTGGSSERENPGKQSQTLQFSEDTARQLWEILGKEFGFS